ncbi:Scr1 family TA system antitoxin-like transcriptional regulator [Streptomyces fradiae]|uniref:Scr1 family TA system antitoxin-like transcriptional regulator n=1 Tax=Streptomyces fradiae TaxID=1906 RepID=UPI0035BEA467
MWHDGTAGCEGSHGRRDGRYGRGRGSGGRTVQRGQVEQLLRMGRLRHVEIQGMPTASEEHAGMGGPFTLLTPKGRPQVADLEVQHVSRLVTDPEEVRVLAAKHGSIRGQALTPRESLRLLEKMPGDL